MRDVDLHAASVQKTPTVQGVMLANVSRRVGVKTASVPLIRELMAVISVRKTAEKDCWVKSNHTHSLDLQENMVQML